MSNRDDFEMDEQNASREIKRQMRGLDAYIPPAPPYETLSPKAGFADTPASGHWESARLRPNFGAPFALVGIALVAVLVLASGAFRAPNTGPAGSRSPVPSPTVPVVAVTPLLATPTLLPGSLFSGPVQSVAWSPAGTMVAITEGASGSSPDVKILTLDGTTVDTISAGSLGWIDDDTYVAADASGVFVGRVGSTIRQTIPGDYVASIPASTAGAVALELNVTGSNQYVIWSAVTGLSAPRDGVPVEFSPDGTLLAVVHYPRGCCAGLPSPEPTKAPGPTTLDIVRTDTGKSVRSTGDVSWAYGLPVAFSPDSRMIAFRQEPADSTQLENLGLLDIATGKVWAVQTVGLDIVPQHTLAWLDSTHLDLRSSGPSGPEPAGLGVVVSHWPSDVIAMSPSSRGDVATVETGPNQVVIRGGGREIIRDLPGTFDSVQLLWSPDGSALLVVCMSYDSRTPSQVVLLRP